jgi:hypothetical protein
MSVAPRARFDTPPDLRAANRAAQQHGLLRMDQLAACGLDRGAVARRARKGWLHRVHTGVYALGYAPQTLDAHFMAAALAGGEGALLSGWATCGLAALVRWDGGPIDVTVRGSAARRRAGIFHRTRSLVLDLVLDEGFEHPQVNQRLIVGPATDRTPYFPDLRWPAQHLILEIDSAWHDDALAQELDAVRQAELEAAGERVLRTTLEQARANPPQLFARLDAAGAPRVWHHGALPRRVQATSV